MENANRLPWVLLALLVVSMTACAPEPPYELQRPWSASELELVTFEDTTLSARRLASDPSGQTIALGPALATEIWTAVAVEGGEHARATVDLDGGESTPCVVDAPGRWQPCRFRLAHAAAGLALRIAVSGPADARAIVAQPLVRTGAPRSGLLVVILMDTVRRDRLVTFEPRIPIGTALDRLARDGVVLDRLYSSSSWTRTAVATLFTGLDASTHAVYGRDDVLPSERDQLAPALQRRGWRTLAWSSNPNVIPLWGFARGFDEFHDVGASAWPKAKAHAEAVLGKAREALDDLGTSPTFFYVHLMDPHAPYAPSDADLQAVTADAALLATLPAADASPSLQNEYARYLAELRGMDRALGAFFDDLRTRGLYDAATILVVSDHGEEFLDHGGVRHGKTLYEEMLRVPAFVKLPGNALAGTRLGGETGLADLAPTLLGVLGLPPLAAADGRNLWDADRHAFQDGSATQSAVLKLDTFDLAALVADRRKLVVDHLGSDRLFDLAADPLERTNLLPAAAAEADRLRSDLDARVARHAAGWHVRVCGGDVAERRRFTLHAVGAAQGAQLEPEDQLRLAQRQNALATYDVDFDLTPRASTRVVEGRIWNGMRPDEDEIVVTSPNTTQLTLSAPPDAMLRLALGTNAEERESHVITVVADDPAVRVRASVPVDCRPQSWNAAAPSSDRPAYLRIWYVAPSERVPDGQVDPALQERLRVLGYQR